MGKYNPVEDFVYRAQRLSPEQRQQIVLQLASVGFDEEEEAKKLAEIVPLMEGSSFEEVEKQVEKGDTVEGFSTGYWTLDRMTAGLVPGELTILAAESGVGKTNLCVNMIARQLPLGYRVLMITLENSAKSIRRRLRLIMGKDYFQLLVGDNFYIQKVPQYPYSSIKYSIEQAKGLGVNIVYIDHLQYLQEDIGNPVEELGRMVKGCKTLSQQYEVPIVLVSQFRKLERGNTGGVDDLYGSAKIRQSADIILIGGYDEVETFPHVKMTVHKQRDRVLWQRYSSVILKQYGFDLEEPGYSEEIDAQNDVTGVPRGRGSDALTFLE